MRTALLSRRPAGVALETHRSLAQPRSRSSRTSSSRVRASASATQQQQMEDPQRFAAASAAAHVAQLVALPFPPVQPLIGCEAGSFAQDTITTRLPAIMDTVLADLALQAEQPGADKAQVAAAVAAVRAMQAEMPVDGPLAVLEVPAGLAASHPLSSIIPATNAAVAAWQQHMASAPWLQQLQPAAAAADTSSSSSGGAAQASWLQLPWLVVECYLYVRLAAIVASQPSLRNSSYDPFFRQKGSALTKSMAAAADIAAALQALLAQHTADAAAAMAAAAAAAGGSSRLGLGEALLGTAGKERLYELFQYALWGNKTDLSMLVDAAHMDAAALGLKTSSSSSSNNSSSSNIIVDEFDSLWRYLKVKARHEPIMTAASSTDDGDYSSAPADYSSAPAAAAGGGAAGPTAAAATAAAALQHVAPLLPRIDIILDNAGLELYTDLALADYLVTSGFAATVVLHGKQLPWFVSDTLEHDLSHIIQTCVSSSGGSDGGAVAAVAARWREHLQAGSWVFRADSFWTTPHPFWWMQKLAPKLHADLSNSCLLIFKGDLNYRKLAGDCRWPATTPFREALTGFCPAPLVSLRTLKADVIAGLAPGEAEVLDRLDPKWQVNGKFGVVQFAESA